MQQFNSALSFFSSHKNINHLLIFLFAAMGILFFYHTHGYLYFGYYITDEHHILKSSALLSNDGIIETFKYHFKTETQHSHRIRFFYKWFLTLQTHILGFNWKIWNVLRMLSAIVTFFLFYLSFFKISSKYLLSILGAVYIILGPQSTVFLRFGPCERYGIVLLSVALLSLIYYLLNKKSYLLIVSVGAFMLSGFSKESFILFGLPLSLLPFAINYDKIFSKFNVVTAAIYALAFAIMMSILFYFESKAPGYADSDSSMLGQMIEAVFQEKIILLNIISLLGISIVYLIFNSSKKAFFFLCVIAILFLFATLPQIYIYSESKFRFGRYFLPFLVGLPLALSLIQQDTIHFKNHIKRESLVYGLSTVCLLLLLTYNVFGNIYFKKIGELENSKRLITKILADIENYSEPQDSILIVGDPAVNYEPMMFGYTDYLEIVLKYKNISFLPLEVDYKGADHLIKLKDDFIRKNGARSFSEIEIDLHKFKYIMVLNSATWYKGIKFNNNLSQFDSLFQLQKDEDFKFIRIKNNNLISYVRYQSDFHKNLNPSFEEIPFFINAINNQKKTYKSLSKLNDWEINHSDPLVINGIIQKDISQVYVGIDTSFIECSTQKDIRKNKKVVTRFRCNFKNKIIKDTKLHRISPVALSPDSTTYWFLPSPFEQPRFRFRN